MAVSFNDALANAQLDGILNTYAGQAFDGGSAVLEIRGTPRPATANDAATGTLLASFTLPTDCFNAAASRASALSAQIQDTSADASGTAVWCRMRNTGDTLRIDGDVTVTSGGGLVELDSLSITATGTVTITGGSLTVAAA